MLISYCALCGGPIFNTERHICGESEDRRNYYGPIGEEKTFSDKLYDARLMYGEIDE